MGDCLPGDMDWPGYQGASKGQESQLLPGNQRDVNSFA